MSLAADLSASESARRVYLLAGGLVVLGIALAILTVWFWRTTRPEPPSLAPLEVMSDRGWSKLDETARAHRIEAVRPGAQLAVVEPSPEVDLRAPEVDLAAADPERPTGLDDLGEHELREHQEVAVADDTSVTLVPEVSVVDPLLVDPLLVDHDSAQRRG